MKFSDLRNSRASRAVPKVVTLPVYTGGDAREEVKVGLRFIGGGESASIMVSAGEFAIANGAKDPKPGDALFELGLRVHTLLVACVDPDEAGTAGARFFDSIDQILEKGEADPMLGRDGIAFLFEEHEAWQDFCGPQPPGLSDETLWTKVMEVAASEDPLVFEALRPSTRWRLARFMASQLLILLTSKLESLPKHSTETNENAQPPKSVSVKKPNAKRRK